MISAAAILNAFNLRHRAAGLAKLDGLPTAVHARIQSAIAALPAGAVVDLDKLVEEARRQAEREAQQRPAPEPWRYWLSAVATHDQHAGFKHLIENGTEPDAAMQIVLAGVRRQLEGDTGARLDGIASRLGEITSARTVAADVLPDGVEPKDEPNESRRCARRTRLPKSEASPK